MKEILDFQQKREQVNHEKSKLFRKILNHMVLFESSGLLMLSYFDQMKIFSFKFSFLFMGF